MFLFWTTEKVNKIKAICDAVNFYCPPLGEEPIHLCSYSLIPQRYQHNTLSHVKCLHNSITHNKWKKVSVPYLLCCFYGKKLMLAFSSTNIAKCTIVCYIPSNKGDFVYWMLVLYDLELGKK